MVKRRKLYIKRAELVGNPDTKEKYVRYNGVKYKLKEKDWNKAEQEAKELLKQIYKEDIIIC